MTRRPFATVLIDTYNHEAFIEEAIESVLKQDFPAGEMEILVVNDGSTDRTGEIMDRIAQIIATNPANTNNGITSERPTMSNSTGASPSVPI